MSDASTQKHGYSGFAWVIANDQTQLWRGLGLAPGPAKDMYSGRAKAFGLLAATHFLVYYLQCYTTHPPEMMIKCFCDNLGVINTINAMQTQGIPWPNDMMQDDHYVYLAIVANIKQCSPTCLQFFHIRSHQDRNSDQPLTTPELLNIACDKRAKKHVQETHLCSTSLPNPEIAQAQPHLCIPGQNHLLAIPPSLMTSRLSVTVPEISAKEVPLDECGHR